MLNLSKFLSKFQEVDFCCCSLFFFLQSYNYLHCNCRAQLLCKHHFPTWQTSVPWKIPRSAKQRCTGSLLAGRAMPSCQGHRRGYSLTGHWFHWKLCQGQGDDTSISSWISTCFLANCWWRCHRWWPEQGLKNTARAQLRGSCGRIKYVRWTALVCRRWSTPNLW